MYGKDWKFTIQFALIFIFVFVYSICGRVYDKDQFPGDNFIHVEINREFRELRIAFKGILVIETSAFQNSSYELHFRQITNGHDFIQILFQDGDVKDCEYSREPKQILEFVHKFSLVKPTQTDEGDSHYLYISGDISKGNSTTNRFKHRKDLGDFKDFVKIRTAMKLCNRLVEQSLESQDKYNSFEYIRIKNGRHNKRKSNKKRHNYLPRVHEGGMRDIDTNSTIIHHRRKRSAMNKYLMFPGTKWCGRGQTALHYDDVGEDREADVCCRDHDCCPDLIPSFSTRYNVFNYRFHAILHCNCDDRFRWCLKQSFSPMATLIGRIYFNIMGSKCFTLKKDNVCIERSWWGYCLKYGEQEVAVVESQESFNCF